MESRTINWQTIYHRLDVTSVAIAGELNHGPEETRRTLEARARAAAKPPAKPDNAVRVEVLTFSLASENYAVETGHVHEVCQLKEITAVPCTPSFIVGVMNLRGRIVAIVDLRKIFEMPARGLTELNRVIILNGAGSELGLLADSITGVRSVRASDLQEGLATLTGIRKRFFKGVTGQMLAVLDGAQLLGDAGLKVNERVAR
jgi:purine-binding chemotaxis protein CheW